MSHASPAVNHVEAKETSSWGSTWCIIRAMEEAADDFLAKLHDRLTVRAAWLESTELQSLRADLRRFGTLFASVVGTLLKKGLLREDRYEYEGRPTEIRTPHDNPILNRAESDEVGSRLAAYRRQLDFLVDGDLLRLEALDLARLDGIASLIAYIDWANFGETAHSPTTRAFARLVARLTVGADPLSSKVVHESLDHIRKLVKEIKSHINEIESWRRESWKAEVRTRVLPLVKRQDAGSQEREEKNDELFAIKGTFEKILPGTHWWPELVKQILEEDFAGDSAARKQKLLSALELPPAGKPEPRAGKKELMGAVRGLCHVAEDIGAAEAILVENEHGLERRTLSFMQRLRRLFQRRLGRLDDRFYNISLGESSNAEPRKETVDFLRFVAELREIREILGQLTDQAGGEGHRIDLMTEEELCEFLNWQIAEIRDTHRRMEGLNELFQVKAVHERKEIPARSIKLQLLRIENALARADEARCQYLSDRSQPSSGSNA